MKTWHEIAEAFRNDEKLLSLDAPIEALAPELHQDGIVALKAIGINTVRDFHGKTFDEFSIALGKLDEKQCDWDLFNEILDSWLEITGNSDPFLEDEEGNQP
jgi:hypothetical protein